VRDTSSPNAPAQDKGKRWIGGGQALKLAKKEMLKEKGVKVATGKLAIWLIRAGKSLKEKKKGEELR